MKKRMLHILLTLCIMLCFVPTATLAAGTPNGTALTQESIKNLEILNGWYILRNDTYYLAEDVTLDLPLNIKETVTLDLNGHVLELGGNCIQCIHSSELTLTDSGSSVEHKFRVEDSGLWVWDEENGTKTVKGGVITGGEGYKPYPVENGGGVYVYNATFTMSGGSIVGCTSAIDGGGVYVDSDNHATFTMSGGSIVGCTAARDGGGVSVNGNNSTFTMKSGDITGCIAAGDGGGVYVVGDKSVFTMEGGSITGCTARRGGGVYTTTYDTGSGFTMKSGSSITSCTADCGGGVYVQGATFTMSGGSITSCSAAAAGGGVYVYNDNRAAFTMNGGTISSCTAGGADNAVHADGSFTDNSTAKIDKSLVTGINAGHAGTEADPILIASAEGLKDFRNRVNKGETTLCAKLTADIVLNDGSFDEDGNWSEIGAPYNWTPIGSYTNSGRVYYTGTFDGGGHTIKGLYINSDDYNIGLFGQVKDATIQNLTVTGYVKGNGSVGGIVGEAYGSSEILNCVNYSNVTGDGSSVGGIVGKAYGSSKILNCVNYSNVTGDGRSVGGIVGNGHITTIRSCANCGNVTGGSDHVGGIVGYCEKGIIENCANLGGVNGSNNYTGGIVGYVVNSTKMTACYNVGKVEGNRLVGGLVGYAGWNDQDGNVLTASNCCYLNTAATDAFGKADHFKGDTTEWGKSVAEFANGSVLALLRQADAAAWRSECGYLAAAGMTLPLLSWQTADDHTCTPEDASRWESDESGHWQVCSCGLIVNKADHFGTDDGDCTTEVSCDKCGYVIKLARLEHDWTAGWTAVRPGATHSKVCNTDGCGVTQTGSCTGGTATCKEQATCDVCGGKYGSYADHSYTAQTVDTEYLKSDATCTEQAVYYKSCAVCGLSSEGTADEAIFQSGDALDHDYGAWTSNGDGTHTRTCARDAQHTETEACTGGTADCTHQATCSTCGEKYGAVDPSNHIGTAVWIPTATTHVKKYTCCDAIEVAEAAHHWDNGVCTECGYGCIHSGGEASCTSQAVCTVCGHPYGALKPHDFTAENTDEKYLKTAPTCTQQAVYYKSCAVCGLSSVGTADEATFQSGDALDHDFGAWTSNGDGTHTRTCSRDTLHTETENCSGGTADCHTKAVCAVCGAHYGEMDAANHTGGTEIRNAAGATCTVDGYTGDTYCTGCDAVLTSGTAIPAIGHSGGTADCHSKAICAVCGVSYGELDPASHVNLTHVDAKAATADAEGNTEFWNCDGCGKYFADAAATKEITKADTVTTKLKVEVTSPAAPTKEPASAPEPAKEAASAASPRTADSSNPALWLTLMGLSGGAGLALTITGKKKKHRK